MTLYSIVLFIHIACVLGLFACLSFEALSLFRLRQASSVAEVHLWMEPVPALPLWISASALGIFLSGGYLAMRMSAFGLSWIEVAITALLLIAPLGALSGKRMRAIRQCSAGAQRVDPELSRRLRDPVLKISLGIRISIFLGIVLLMAAKPELWESIGIVATSVVLGFLVSRISGQSGHQLSDPRIGVGSQLP